VLTVSGSGHQPTPTYVVSLESPGCPLESITGIDRIIQVSQRRDAKQYVHHRGHT